MEKEMLDTIIQQLDRLEKIIAELNQKLSAVIEEVATHTPQRLLRAARAEGLQTFNPEIGSQQTLTDWIA